MQTLGKVYFFIFSREFFAEGLDHSPRQRSLPRAMVKALGKDQRNLQIHIYIPSHTESPQRAHTSHEHHIYISRTCSSEAFTCILSMSCIYVFLCIL